ncbi:MAG: hypothetical protein O2958_10185 [Gemmatimonadetes bacterium]|nr:hypothetical protein [Gemmatimonadota bacterium]MDA1103366.1 hypothetical protein [Gemmatimonadota bacterium]
MPDPIERLNKALEGRYHVERELGQGGMATVYLADDLKHERKVALKVLKPELAAVVGAERFLHGNQDDGQPAAPQHPSAARLRGGRFLPLLRHAVRRGRKPEGEVGSRRSAPGR